MNRPQTPKLEPIAEAYTTTQPTPVKSKSGHCPPGLAKKAVPCVPPGQAKRYRVGDYIYDGYVRIDNPNRYGLRRNGYYVRAGDYVYEVNRETHEVLNLIGAIANVLN
ncbi:excinuclease ABC subunit A [Ruegeria arenilitoris]|uniref:excinuclease ABC subunit A n=1 Tax=Ruegeria arenilitoris TaxID=1173585 RepID=UPI0020C4965A|nr:excinuclease ABC subunit A [Ruegeria arenilitoris]